MKKSTSQLLITLLISVTVAAGIVLLKDYDTVDAPDTQESGVYSASVQEDCLLLKEQHIVHCGERIPEEDYVCRTVEAEQAYQECLRGTE